MGDALYDAGDLAQAMEHFQRALSIDEEAYGLGHPTVAIRINNSGCVLRDIGDLAGAREYFQRALDIFRDRLEKATPTQWMLATT